MGLVEIFGWVLFVIGAAAFGWLTRRRGSLTTGGAVAAVVLGLVITLTSGPVWLVPLFVFFLSSSLLGRFLPTATTVSDDKDRQPRDLVQVLCNGGVYGLLALLDLDPTLLLVTMAVATSDTWASEIGKYFRQPTFDIVRWRRVPSGLSGGVSRSGNLGGAAGATIIAGLGYLLLPEYGHAEFLTVATLGFVGMLADSVMGAALQARYRDANSGVLSDRDMGRSRLVSGLRWMTNDLVNLLAISLTVALAAAIS